jgi:hypothetical protein
MAFVYSTHGTPEENAWSYNKARFDAETWYYRGNGAVDLLSDEQALAEKNRNLILYGNSDINSAWKSLLAGCPILVSRDAVSIGHDRLAGDGLSALFLYPQGGRMIGVVGGTGTTGLRVTDRLPVFTSGIAYPDWTILSPNAYAVGTEAVLAAGYFENDWKLK